MRIEVIFCPSCNNKLRVPEELMARPVQCPQCRATFLAPPPPVTAPVPENEPRERPRPPSFQVEDFDRPEEPASEGSDAKILAPAFVLLAVAVLGMLLNVVQIAVVGFMPNFWKQFKAASPFQQAAGTDQSYIIFATIFFLVSLTSAFGAVSMMKRRLYPIAILGSLAAIFNIGQCCCILGAPIGIWALIVLFQPDVRASFR